MYVAKEFYDDSRNFEYQCLCNTFNILRAFDSRTNSYLDKVKSGYATCSESHINTSRKNHPYSLNSINLRSDELSETHAGTHIVFSGCSQTWGHGLDNLESLWSHIVNNRFSNSSGYFNLARGGWNTSMIVSDLIAYCHSYGMPDYIFALMPEIDREPIVSNSDYVDLSDFQKQYLQQIKERYVFNALIALESFCKVNEITLNYSTWSGPAARIYKKWKLSNYIDIVDLDKKDYFFVSNLQDDGHWTEEHNKKFAELMLDRVK